MKYIYLILLYVLFMPLEATEYYVDSNGGADFKNIQDAANIVQAGDTIYIKAGRYKERLFLEHSGTSSQPIIFKKFQNDKVIIDGTDINWSVSWGGLIDISDVSYIEVSGIEIINSNHAGIFLDNAHHIEIQNMKIHNTFSSGIGVWYSHEIHIKNSEISLACNDGGEESISIAESFNVNVEYNDVHHNGAGTNGGEGIDVKQGSHDVVVAYNKVHHLHNRIGVYADAWDKHTYNIRFDSNRIYACGNTGMAVASELGGRIEYVTFVNNIVYNNRDGGMAVGGWTADGKNAVSNPVEHITIVNNTFYHNTQSDGIFIGNPDAKDIKIYNNIIWKNEGEEIYIEHTPVSEVEILNNLFTNPKFVNVNTFDFHLKPNSAAINRGVLHQYTSIDYDKNKRLHNGLWDIGAYSFNGLELFVERFYEKILLRHSDKAGLLHWVSALEGLSKSGADIAKGFIFSDEFRQRDLDDEAYVTVLYRAFFDRKPDVEGFVLWLNILSHGIDKEQIRAEVLDGFLHSEEFMILSKKYNILAHATPVELFVSRFYKQTLERMPDSKGLAHWSDGLRSGVIMAKDVAFGFIFSDEFITRDVDNAKYVTILYRAFFAREPDSAGFEHWKIQLDTGTSRATVLNGFLGAVEFINLAKVYGMK